MVNHESCLQKMATTTWLISSSLWNAWKRNRRYMYETANGTFMWNKQHPCISQGLSELQCQYMFTKCRYFFIFYIFCMVWMRRGSFSVLTSWVTSVCLTDVITLTEGCPGLCNSNGRCTLDQNGWHCVCQSGWRGAGCDVAMETLCTDGKDNEGGEGTHWNVRIAGLRASRLISCLFDLFWLVNKTAPGCNQTGKLHPVPLVPGGRRGGREDDQFESDLQPTTNTPAQY